MIGRSATIVATNHKKSNVAAAVFFEGCFLASGCVTETNLSHVTKESIRTDDSHDNVLRNPRKWKHLLWYFYVEFEDNYHKACKYSCVSIYTGSWDTLRDNIDLVQQLSVNRYPLAGPKVPSSWGTASELYCCLVQNVVPIAQQYFLYSQLLPLPKHWKMKIITPLFGTSAKIFE